MTAHIPQAAIERARPYAADWYVDNEGLVEAYRGRIKSGKWDSDQLVQAFAKAIADEQERCARVAERQTTDTGFSAQTYNYARRDAATSIRGVTPNG